MKKIILKLLMLYFLTACSQNDVENISLSGVVRNSMTNKIIQIKKSEFKIECWKYSGSKDESYSDSEKVYIETNDKGEFSKTFDKGALIIFIIKAEGYQKFVKKIYVKESNNVCDVNLIPL